MEAAPGPASHPSLLLYGDRSATPVPRPRAPDRPQHHSRYTAWKEMLSPSFLLWIRATFPRGRCFPPLLWPSNTTDCQLRDHQAQGTQALPGYQPWVFPRTLASCRTGDVVWADAEAGLAHSQCSPHRSGRTMAEPDALRTMDGTKAGKASCVHELWTEHPWPPQPGPRSAVALPAGAGQGHQLINWGNSSKNALGSMSHLSNVHGQANRSGK